LFCATPGAFNLSAEAEASPYFNETFTCAELASTFNVDLLLENCTNPEILSLLWLVASVCCSDHIANTACGEPEIQSVCQNPVNFNPNALIDNVDAACWVLNVPYISAAFMVGVLIEGCDADLAQNIIEISEFCCDGGVDAHNTLCDTGTWYRADLHEE
jgi:hypothetical protein